jgi:hypothetical protein
MIKLFGFLFFLVDVFFEKAFAIAAALHDRGQARKDEQRRRRLLSLDAGEVRKDGDLSSIILARQVEVAKGGHLQEGMVRKGGINPWPSRVITRPGSPGPMKRYV